MFELSCTQITLLFSARVALLGGQQTCIKMYSLFTNIFPLRSALENLMNWPACILSWIMHTIHLAEARHLLVSHTVFSLVHLPGLFFRLNFCHFKSISGSQFLWLAQGDCLDSTSIPKRSRAPHAPHLFSSTMPDCEKGDWKGMVSYISPMG